jgi:N-acetylmuramate 1-kinase
VAQVPFSLTPLTDLATAHFKVADIALEYEPMPGGASTRRFVRVRPRDAGAADGTPSAIGMFFPDADTPEEVTSGAKTARWPFLEVQQLLQERGVRVPVVYGEACRSGWLLVEDLGDVTLAAALEADPGAKLSLYQAAVKALAQAQLALGELPAHSIVKQRSFNGELLRWEIDHFREFGLEAQGVTLSPTERAEFDAAAEYITGQILQLQYGFVHRDYQSRNLMVLGTGNPVELGWVDFQDALLGPRIYDLVALLNDSYQSFSPEFVTDRLREFRDHRQLPPGTEAALQREFDLVTIQRKLKDAGRFVFIERKKGDASYLRFFEPTLERVLAATERLSATPELRNFAALLQDLRARLP